MSSGRVTRSRTRVIQPDAGRSSEALVGVRRTTADELAQWRYHGRLVARELDDARLVIRADFHTRDWMLRQFPKRNQLSTVIDAHGGLERRNQLDAGLGAPDPRSSRRRSRARRSSTAS